MENILWLGARINFLSMMPNGFSAIVTDMEVLETQGKWIKLYKVEDERDEDDLPGWYNSDYWVKVDFQT